MHWGRKLFVHMLTQPRRDNRLFGRAAMHVHLTSKAVPYPGRIWPCLTVETHHDRKVLLETYVTLLYHLKLYDLYILSACFG